MNSPVTVSRTDSPASLALPLVADTSHYFITGDETRVEIRDAKGWLVAQVWGHGEQSKKKAESLRDEMIHACNNHSALLSALQRLTHPMASDEDLDNARELVARLS